MAELRKTTCCGLREFDGITEFDDPAEILRAIWPNWSAWRGAFVLLTCPTKDTIGRRLANYIEKHELGTVMKSPVKMNPNSGNNLRVMVWGVDNNAFPRWIEKNSPMGRLIQVGDRVQGNAHANTQYATTNEGWIGIVTEVSANGQRFNADDVRTGATYYDLNRPYFDIIV